MISNSQRLDPQVAAFLNQLEAESPPPLSDLTPSDARQISKTFMQAVSLPPRETVRIHSLTLTANSRAISLRVYTPLGTVRSPVLVYFHGGGWVLSDVHLYDGLCASLADLSGSVVVSVDYRLAPEYPFPAGLEDCYLAAQWVRENAFLLRGDPDRIVVAGDSAGGTLAAVVARLCAQDQNKAPLAAQLLLYPVMNLASMGTGSYREFATGYFLTQASMEWFRGHYLADLTQAQNPNASPLLATDWQHLPPAIIVTAGCDVVRDEGEAYAEHLRAAGNRVELKRYEGMIHGFLMMDASFDRATTALAEIALTLRSMLER